MKSPGPPAGASAAVPMFFRSKWVSLQRHGPVFSAFSEQLHAGIDIPWSEMALECGYYDQSHFANESRAFSGIDTTTYSARRALWTNHIPVD